MLEQLRAVIDVKDSEPGVALGAIRDGRVILRWCAGRASLEHGVAIGPSTRFHVVSVTKTFTAAAIVALAARGKLTLDDPVERFVPELPAAGGDALTLRHLLSMTSGLYDSLELERLRGVWRPSPERERDLLDPAFLYPDGSGAYVDADDYRAHGARQPIRSGAGDRRPVQYRR
jgi:CubicO group peptidase (beta-lactamase class C family)